MPVYRVLQAYFSKELNDFILNHTEHNDLSKLLLHAKDIVAYYNKLCQNLTNSNSNRSNLNPVQSKYLDELCMIAYDYYQKAYFLVFVRIPQLPHFIQIADQGPGAGAGTTVMLLYTQLKSAILNDSYIVWLRKYIESSNFHRADSLFESVHSTATALLTHLTQTPNTTLILDTRDPIDYNRTHINTRNIMNVEIDKVSKLSLAWDQFQNIVICTDQSSLNPILPLFINIIEQLILTNTHTQVSFLRFNIDEWARIGGPIIHSPPPNMALSSSDTIFVGLQNEYNSCYISCIIQSLLPINELTSRILNNSYLNESNPTRYNANNNLITSFASLIQNIELVSNFNKQNGTNYMVSCLDFKNQCGKMNSIFNGDYEADCQEFCQFLLDTLHEELTNKSNNIAIETDNSNNQFNLSFQQMCQLEWNNYLLRNSSLIADLFQGQIVSTLRCQVCHFESRTFQIFTMLSLPVPMRKRFCNIMDSLKQFSRSETLSIGDQWFCSNCKERRPSSQQLQLGRLPNILIIQFNRFNDNLTKNNCFINYPQELDISQFSIFDNKDDKYELFAVTTHQGNLTKGHYSSYAMKSLNQWWLFDDTVYRPIRLANEFIHPDAYLLFYRRKTS